MRRAWISLAWLLLLHGCDCNEHRTRKSGDAGVQPKANSDAGMSGTGGRGLTTTGRAGNAAVDCVPGGFEQGEFRIAACPDAGPRKNCGADGGGRCASEDDAAVTDRDAGQSLPRSDAGHTQPRSDAGAPSDDRPPCTDPGYGAPSCPGPALSWDLASIECAITGNDSLSVKARACEACGLNGTYEQPTSIYVVDCGTCNKRNEFGFTDAASSEPYAPHECREHVLTEWTAYFSNAHRCMDVHLLAKVASSSGVPREGALTNAVLACRCDRISGRCVTCRDGACSREIPADADHPVGGAQCDALLEETQAQRRESRVCDPNQPDSCQPVRGVCGCDQVVHDPSSAAVAGYLDAVKAFDAAGCNADCGPNSCPRFHYACVNAGSFSVCEQQLTP